MSGIKLRQAFRALQDDDFDGVGRIELDEQEQEQLIQRLQNQNQQSDAWFTWAFIGFNILVLLTIVYQSEWSATPPEIVVPIFSVASIVFNISTLATWRRPSTQAESKVGSLISRLHRCRATLAVPLSLTFGLLSGVTAYSLRGHGAFSGRPWLLYWTPLLMVLTTLSQEKLISSVDVTELERLKYAYKGA